MQVREIIRSKLLSVTLETPLKDAAQIMRTQNVGALPVLDNGRGVGFITDRDIAVRAVAQGLGPNTKIRDVMSKKCYLCDEDTSLEAAAQLMDKQHVRRLLVTDKKQKRPLGIVSLADIAAHTTKSDVVINTVKHLKDFEKGVIAL